MTSSVVLRPRWRAVSGGRCLLLLCMLVASCDGRDAAPTPRAAVSTSASSAEAAAPVGLPPSVAFTAPEPWRSRGTPGQTIDPPNPADETWRVYVHQHDPMQVETPRWQPLPATASVTVAMQPESGLRCIVTPLQISADENDFGTKLKAWLLRRALLCSGDGWRTWSEHPHGVRILPDGTRETTYARALLRERVGDQVRRTSVLVRDDTEKRAASTGPPQILPDAPVDDD